MAFLTKKIKNFHKSKVDGLEKLPTRAYLFNDLMHFKGCHFTKSGLFQKRIGNRGSFFGFMHVSYGNN